MRTFISFQEALSLVLASAPVQRAESVPLVESVGRTLAEDLVAREAVPAFESSAMDGYAVIAGDLRSGGAELEVREVIPAGRTGESSVVSGTCARIMTGAPVPDGADAVVPQEWTVRKGDVVQVNRSAEPGQYMRPAGEDIAHGDVIAGEGAVITPAVLGLCAGLGMERVPVRKRPDIAIVTTGSEVVDAGASPGPGQIRNVNGPVLEVLVGQAGGHSRVRLHARDDRTALNGVVEEALAADIVLFSGGVSVGEFDLVQDTLADFGFDPGFWKVKQRPGKPLLFGTIEGRPVLGLPGNPVSTYVAFEIYVRPLIAASLGRTDVGPRLLPGVLAETVRKPEGLHTFMRGVITDVDGGRMQVRPSGPQRSNLLGSVASADCLIHLPAAWATGEAGAEVQIQLLGGA